MPIFLLAHVLGLWCEFHFQQMGSIVKWLCSMKRLPLRRHFGPQPPASAFSACCLKRSKMECFILSQFYSGLGVIENYPIPRTN